MRSKKKSIGLLFLALPLLLLSACDNKTSSSSTSSSSQNSSLDSSSTTTSSEISTPWTPGEDFLEDADQPSVQNPQGRQSPLNILRKTQGQTGFPTLGEANILVVPVTLSDADQYTLGQYPMSFSSSLLSEIEESFFGEGGEIPSVKEFYDESSGGKLSLDGVVTPLYTMEATVEETLSDIAAKGISPFLKQLTKEVYDYFFVDSTRTYDPQDFDSDDDGKVDGIFLVTPFLAMGFGSSADAAMDALRGDYTISEGALSSPINSVSYVSGYDTFLTSALGTSSAPDSHLYITSLGSMMGLESYLDTVGDSTTGKLRTPLGLLDRMDGYIGDHNPFSKYQMGWIEPEFVTAADIPEEGLTKTITKDHPLALSAKKTGLYGEYLLVDFYAPTGLDAFDSEKPYVYQRHNFLSEGIRLYEVNSTLVYGDEDGYFPTFEMPETTSGRIYSYRHSNSSVNPLSEYGIIDKEPLLSLLSEEGRNRHILDSNVTLSDEDLFREGDVFGLKEGYDFYKDFAFDSGTKLGMTFEVTSVTSESCTILIRRTK